MSSPSRTLRLAYLWVYYTSIMHIWQFAGRAAHLRAFHTNRRSLQINAAWVRCRCGLARDANELQTLSPDQFVVELPPTGKRVTGMAINRIAGDKIVETWNNFDALGQLQQLGVIPAPGQSGP